MNDEVTRQDILFVRISKELKVLQRQAERAERLLGHIEGSSRMFQSLGAKQTPCVYRPIDFSVEHDPHLTVFEPAFALFDEQYEGLKAYVVKLQRDIAIKRKLIDAYHRDEDILIARLSAE